MATIRPFRALRPIPALCGAVASVPYDVVSVPEARALAAGNPHSFLHVVRPEIDLPETTGEYADAVYTKGAENLRSYATSDHSIRDVTPALYIYRLRAFGREQTGIFGCIPVADYDSGGVLKHEKTRPVKVRDRVRHILEQEAHAEPVFLTYRDSAHVSTLTERIKQSEPLYNFTADDGVLHTVWKVDDPAQLVAAFVDVPEFYVADGHHRCEAASVAAQSRPDAAQFPAVVFPVSEVNILPYNRFVRRSPLAENELLGAVAARCEIKTDVEYSEPVARGSVCMYTGGRWHSITLPATERPTVADTLDIARLAEFILEPIFRIMDQRRDPNIDFVGGIRGTKELERRVDLLPGSVAFSMVATSMDELIAVSDAHLLMPPKSTWFEPKLRSGILVHPFD